MPELERTHEGSNESNPREFEPARVPGTRGPDAQGPPQRRERAAPVP